MNEAREFLALFGLPAGFISLILVFFKSSPITTATASEIERTIMSKENRSLHNILTYFTQALFHSLFLGYLSYILLSLKNSGSTLFSIQLPPDTDLSQLLIVILMLLFFLSFIATLISKKLSLFFKSSVWGKIIIILFIFLLNSFFSYFLFSVFSTEDFERVEALVAAFIFVFLISALVISPVVTYLLQFIHRKVIYFYIIHKGTKWYLYHPINKNTLLLGNEKKQLQTTKSLLISIKDLENEVIYHES